MSQMDLDSLSVRVKAVVEVLILPILGFGVMLLSDMNKNIQDLNLKVAVILAEGHSTKEKIKDIEVRIKDLEKGNK